MDTSGSVTISDLPPYILIYIFKFINPYDLLFSVRNTCLLWNQLSQEKVLWKTLDVHSFPYYSFIPKSFLELLKNIRDSVECLHFDLIQHDLNVIKHEGISCSNLKEIHLGATEKNRTSINVSDVTNGLVRLSEKYPDLKKLCLVNQVLLVEDIFRNLEEFTFESDVRSVDTMRVKEFLEHHLHLRHITLRKCILSVASVTKILKEYGDIETLDLCGSTCFDDRNSSLCLGDINVCKLKTLNLSETDVNDYLVKKVVMKAKNLKHLNIAKCQRVTNDALETVANNCTELRTLIINVDVVSHFEGQCDITGPGIERIAENCHHLKVLKMNQCPEVGDSAVAAVVKECHELVELEIAGCLSLQDATVVSLVRNCSKIQKLNLGGCPQLTGKSVSAVLEHCKHLQYLNIETCHRVTDLSLLECEMTSEILDLCDKGDTEAEQVVRNTERLENHSRSVDVTSMLEFGKVNDSGYIAEDSGLSDEYIGRETDGLNKNSFSVEVDATVSKFENTNTPSFQYQEALQRHSHVTVLNLSFCSKISNYCVKQIALHCADLRELDIQACYMVTNAGVRHLLKHCHFLQALNISGGSVSQTSRLTDECLEDIIKYGKNLRKLVMVKNYNITADAVFKVIKHCEVIESVRIEEGLRSNISKEMLIELSGRIEDKTICLFFRADVTISVIKDAEFKLRIKNPVESSCQ